MSCEGPTTYIHVHLLHGLFFWSLGMFYMPMTLMYPSLYEFLSRFSSFNYYFMRKDHVVSWDQ